MKRNEKQLLELFSDDSLVMDSRFKEKLRSKIMKRVKPTTVKRSKWQLSAMAVGVSALVFMLTQLPLARNENGGQTPIIDTPLFVQKVSAAAIESGSKGFQKKLSTVPYIFSVASTEAGPQYESCSTGAMGVPIGEVWTTYAFMSKDSGEEAFYQTKQGREGAVRQTTAYYNSSSSQLSGVLDGLIGYPFSLEDGYYTVVDQSGVSQTDETLYEAIALKGNKYYEVYLGVADGLLRCGDDKLYMKYTIDASNFSIRQVDQYRGLPADEKNLVYTYKENVTVESVDSKTAIGRMKKAGFNPANALSDFPAYIQE